MVEFYIYSLSQAVGLIPEGVYFTRLVKIRMNALMLIYTLILIPLILMKIQDPGPLGLKNSRVRYILI